MTLNTSFFNVGIYKNTLKRFGLGGFIYFVLLFFGVPFVLLVNDVERFSYYASEPPGLLTDAGFIIFPLLLAFVVPTVVAALIFNNVHSSKQSIFVHGLPLTRLENYVSSILAAFTLMAVPILLNSIILFFISLGDYAELISFSSILEWISINLSVLFVMFSVATFTAFLTGNTAAHIGINVLFHIIPLIIALTIYLISDIFLFGFMQSDAYIGNKIINNTPVVWIFSSVANLFGTERGLGVFGSVQMWTYIVGAVLVYVLGYYVYKNRKVEASGDVAAFRVFRPIFKYTVTSAAAVVVFAILTGMNLGAVPTFIAAGVLTAIVYFVCEMIMNKSLKVFKAYKGYIGFVVFCALFISFFAYTSVLGYETRIPKTDNIQSSGVYYGWINEIPNITDAELVEATREIHKELTDNIPVTALKEQRTDRDIETVCVAYKLKNGKLFKRRYYVTSEQSEKIMDKMYENIAYKLNATEIDMLNIENINHLNLCFIGGGFNHYIAVNEDAGEIVAAVKKDVEELSFREIQRSDNWINISVEIECSGLENEKLKIFKEKENEEQKSVYYIPKDNYRRFYIVLNSNFKNTYKLLEEKGYINEGLYSLAGNFSVCKNPLVRSGDEYLYKTDKGRLEEFIVSSADCVKISVEDGEKLARVLFSEKVAEPSEGENYVIFNDYNQEDRWLGSKSITFEKSNVPDYLMKYIEK